MATPRAPSATDMRYVIRRNDGVPSIPAWTSAPSIVFDFGVASTYDLRNNLSAFIAGANGVWITSGTLPDGVTLDSDLYTIRYDGVGAIAGPVSVTFDVGLIGDADWHWRRSQFGERGSNATTDVLAWPSRRFETQQEAADGDWLGSGVTGGNPRMRWDSTVRPPNCAAGGSIKQTVLAADGSTSNTNWVIGFADTRTNLVKEFRDAGEKFYFQVRFKHEAAFLNQTWSGQGPKFFILAHSPAAGWGISEIRNNLANSKPWLTQVCQLIDKQNAFRMYHCNTGYAWGKTVDLTAGGGTSTDRRYFDYYDAGVTDPVNRYAPNNRSGSNYTGPTGSNPVPAAQTYPQIYPDEWMTVELEVQLGALSSSGAFCFGQTLNGGWSNCTIRMWVARENATPVLCNEITGVTIFREDNGGNGADVYSPNGLLAGGYGAAWLTAFETGGVGNRSVDVNRWASEIIVSSAPIPFPGVRTLPPRAGL